MCFCFWSVTKELLKNTNGVAEMGCGIFQKHVFIEPDGLVHSQTNMSPII